MRTTGVALFPHAPTSVALARRRLRSELIDAGVSEAAVDDANLIVSELLSNALRHARPLPSGKIRLAWGRRADGMIEVAVSDGGASTEPRCGPSTLSSLGGRGLGIVESLAARWGVRHDHGATTVWALVEAPPAGAGARMAPPVAHAGVAEFADLPDLDDGSWDAPSTRAFPA
ncbi:Histidine kinase-, DNA gyrase B-, and HSP90-like ATPase [Actinomadura rubteroloni]|uniref:Histidine kinase-, DNA gyrase B-, and HSP90-like ATPase n=1 Tax=Actinomadura rubteroloni TaxID=1926885 RepID=A0A2P4UMB9_9ACTN|nr:ATP-binding protein [Actinomadura rubteroloni]POM26194.1 Histidine kinase-, DNA gyrase B-, and HSP90-like ATPase [Actinomadura rubteroloni]